MHHASTIDVQMPTSPKSAGGAVQPAGDVHCPRRARVLTSAATLMGRLNGAGGSPTARGVNAFSKKKALLWDTFSAEGLPLGPGLTLDKEVLQTIIGLFEVVAVPEKQPLFKEGDDADFLAVLLDGKAVMQARQPRAEVLDLVFDKQEVQTLHTLEQFSVVGNLDMLSVEPRKRSATCEATSDTEWLLLRKDNLWTTLKLRMAEIAPKFEAADEAVEMLRALPFFKNCRPFFVDRLAVSATSMVTYEQDTLITRHTTDLIVVMKGYVRTSSDRRALTRTQSTATEVIIGADEIRRPRKTDIKSGQTLGEAAVLGVTKKKTLAAAALEDVKALIIDRGSFWQQLQHFPDEFKEFMANAGKIYADLKIDLQGLSLFSCFPTSAVDAMTSRLRRRSCWPGELLWNEGDPADSVCAVHRGQLQVFIAGILVGTLAEGDCFGESALLGDRATRAAAVKADSFCVVLELPRQDFYDATQDDDAAAAAVAEFREARDVKLSLEGQGDVAKKIVRGLRFFTLCTPQFVEVLYKRLEAKLYVRRQYIVQQGEEGHCMYVMASGSADVEVLGELVGSVLKGDAFGEMAMLGNHPETTRRWASVVTNSISCVMVLHRQVMMNALEEYPYEYVHFHSLAKRHFEAMPSPVSLYALLPLFQHSDHEFIYKVGLYTERRLYFQGDCIVTQGQHGSEMFIMSRGHAAVELDGHQIAGIADHECFGEMALLGITQTRTVTVRATELCDVMVLHRHVLQRIFEEFPEEKTRFDQFTAKRVSDWKNGRALVESLLRSNSPFFRAAPEAMLQKVYDCMQLRLCRPGMSLNSIGDDVIPDGLLLVMVQGDAEVETEAEPSELRSLAEDIEGTDNRDSGLSGDDVEVVKRRAVRKRCTSKSVISAGTAGRLCGRLPEVGVDQPGSYKAKSASIVQCLDRTAFYVILEEFPEMHERLLQVAPTTPEFGAEIAAFRQHLEVHMNGYLQAWKRAFGANSSKVDDLPFAEFLRLYVAVGCKQNLPFLWREVSPDGQTFGMSDIHAASAHRLRTAGSVGGAILKHVLSVGRSEHALKQASGRAKITLDERTEDEMVLNIVNGLNDSQKRRTLKLVRALLPRWKKLAEIHREKESNANLPVIDRDRPFNLEASDPWVVKLEGMFKCGLSTKKLYGKKGRNWHTDYSLVNGPGIPIVPQQLPIMASRPHSASGSSLSSWKNGTASSWQSSVSPSCTASTTLSLPSSTGSARGSSAAPPRRPPQPPPQYRRPVHTAR